jgi:TolB-like protein
MGLVSELRRRNVIRVAIAYAVAAWLLIEVTNTTFPMLRLPEWTATFIAVLLMIGFPMALIFAWAFELTPEGIKLEKQVVRDESTTQFTGRKLDFFIIGLLVAALGYFAFDKFVLDPSRDAELVQTTAEAVIEKVNETGNFGTVDSSIAVLPFVNMSSDPEQEYFSDGISEELLNVLAKIPDLRVAARTSSFQFKGENRDIIDIGQQLNVGLVLEGSVRKAGLQLRITAQLIDTRNGFHLWSESYDRELENIFAVQDEISTAIVDALKEHLGLQAEAEPQAISAANIEAHDAYLRGRHLVVQRTRATIEGAVREFDKATVLDPEYAIAHAELAIATLFLTVYADLTVTEAVARAIPHAERAMALDPTLAEAHAAIGYVLRFQENAEDALKHFEQAVQINPNYAIVYNVMGIVLDRFLGEYNEAFAAYDKALRLDPLSIPAIGNNVRTLIERNRLAEADRGIEKLASIAPRNYAAMRGYRTSLGGKWTNLVLSNLDALQLEPDNPIERYELTWDLAIIGLEKEALAISEQIPPAVLSWLGKPGDAVVTAEARLAEDPVSLTARLDLGLALASAGEYARARPIMEESWQRRGGRITSLSSGDGGIATAAALIAIRRAAGEEAGVAEIVAAIRDNVRRYHEAGITNGPVWYSVDYEAGLADYLAGEHERGLELIAKGAEDGYFIPQSEAYLQTLYDDLGFAPIRAGQEARQARERGRFLAIVCNDNPYAAMWQPVEGTCERFAATRAK